MFTALILIITLSVLVFIHELGHFLAAKWVGIRVDEFALGMGPKLLTLYNDGETEYTIRLFPIGGFVRLLGENGLPEDATEEEKRRSFNHKPVLARIFVLTAGVIMNYLLALVLIAIVLMGLGKPNVQFFTQVTGVAPNSPAESAGIEPDTYIVAFKTQDGDTYMHMQEPDDFVNFVNEHKGQTLDLLIRSNPDDESTERHVSVVARKDPPPGEGSIGVEITTTYSIEYTKVPLWRIPIESVKTSYELAGAIFDGLKDMLGKLVSHGEVPKDVAGPIGVAKITSDAAKQGIYPYLQVLALISINLAIVNILPFPALDGGRLAFVLFEGVTGKRVSSKYEGWIHIIGFIILMGLVVLLSFQDIKRFF